MTGEKAETYTFKSAATSKYISIKQPDGREARLIFALEGTHTLIAAEGGRIELSKDTEGNVFVEVIANEGYTFAGWQAEDGSAFTNTGNVKITKALQLKAVFTKK